MMNLFKKIINCFKKQKELITVDNTNEIIYSALDTEDGRIVIAKAIMGPIYGSFENIENSITDKESIEEISSYDNQGPM